jgi:hypothetical protein
MAGLVLVLTIISLTRNGPRFGWDKTAQSNLSPAKRMMGSKREAPQTTQRAKWSHTILLASEKLKDILH